MNSKFRQLKYYRITDKNGKIKGREDIKEFAECFDEKICKLYRKRYFLTEG